MLSACEVEGLGRCRQIKHVRDAHAGALHRPACRGVLRPVAKLYEVVILV